MGRALAPPPRGRSAAPRRGSLHRRSRPGRERAPRRRPPLAVRARAHRRGSIRRPRSSCRASSASSPAPTSPRCRGPSRRGSTRPIPHYAAAHETSRYVGEPVAVVVARDRYLAEDALELIEVEYEPLEPVLDAEAAARDGCVRLGSLVPLRRRRRRARQRRPRRPERFRFPRWSCTPVECYGVVADWSAAEGSLTAWANFQGPFTLHSVAAARARAPGLEAPADHAARLRRLVRDQVRGLRLRRADGARVAQARRSGALDRGPARAPRRELGVERAGHRASRRASPRTASSIALRYDAIEDVGAYVRAPEPATLYRMHGSLVGRVPRAERRRPQPRRPHEHAAERAEPRLRRPAALPRARADDDDRRAADSGSTRPSFGGATSSRPTSSRTGRRRARSTTPATTRAASTTRSRSRATTSAAQRRPRRARRAGSSASGSPASSSRRSRTWATSRSPSRRETRGLPKSGNAEGCTIVDLRARRDHRAHGDDAAGPGAPHGDRAGRRRPPRRRAAATSTC